MTAHQVEQHTSLDDLLASTPEQLVGRDIAEMNLVCAAGLPGSENLDISQALATLDEWTAIVKQVSDFQLPRLLARPQRMTESQLRLWLIIRTVRDRFGIVHRDGREKNVVEKMGPQIAQRQEAVAGFEGFADSRDVFIHGLLGAERVGTCSSFPVLYAAIARRMGYPVKVATNTGHVFNRWEDERESFNMEGTGANYICTNPDDYYIDEPRRWTDYERYNDYLLRGRTSAGELSLCCAIRAACLYQNGRFDEAIQCWTRSWQLMPENDCEAENLYFVFRQKLPQYVWHDGFPANSHLMWQDTDDSVICLAPAATRAVMVAARGMHEAFYERLAEARGALQTACRLAPDDPTYPRLLATLERRQYHRLPPSKSVLAARKISEDAEDLIRRQELPHAVTRLAKAYRLHPRHPAYWHRIADIARITRGKGQPNGTPPPRFYQPQEVALSLRGSGRWFLARGDLMEAYQAFVEGLHLTPGDLQLRNGMMETIRRLHEAAQAEKQPVSQKVAT